MHERDLIARIESLAGKTSQTPGVIRGIGDDCAVLAPRPETALVVTTDTLVESVHFDLSLTDARLLGRKTAAVNLSDIGAMGGGPRWAFLNVSMRPGIPDAFWDAFCRGVTERLAEWGASLVGGDTVVSRHDLVLTLTLIGEVEPERWLGRANALPGDEIFCSGYLGESALGLAWLRNNGRPCDPASRRVVSRHLDPTPQVTLGQALARSGLVRTAIDLSDGLATDLAHICQESGVGAVVQAGAIPVSRASRTIARHLGLSPLDAALSGGEDYELLWTVPERNAREAATVAASILGRPPFLIGRIVSDRKGVHLESHRGTCEITYQGYEHVA
ncbi:MAG: thiamine-phosphate kinase [Deltaproteobacteria bacterium]